MWDSPTKLYSLDQYNSLFLLLSEKVFLPYKRNPNHLLLSLLYFRVRDTENFLPSRGRLSSLVLETLEVTKWSMVVSLRFDSFNLSNRFEEIRSENISFLARRHLSPAIKFQPIFFNPIRINNNNRQRKKRGRATTANIFIVDGGSIERGRPYLPEVFYRRKNTGGCIWGDIGCGRFP